MMIKLIRTKYAILNDLNYTRIFSMLVIFLILNACSYKKKYEQNVQTNSVFLLDELDEYPKFNGGYNNFSKYINDKIKESPKDIFQNIEGRIYIDFVIDQHGFVKDAKVRSLLPMDVEIVLIEIVNRSPRWIPGKVNGNPVASIQTLPLKF